MLVNFHFWHSLVITTSLALRRKGGRRGGGGERKGCFVYPYAPHKSPYIPTLAANRREKISPLFKFQKVSLSLFLSLWPVVVAVGRSWKKKVFFHFPSFLILSLNRNANRGKGENCIPNPSPTPTSFYCVCTVCRKMQEKKCNPPDFPHKFRNC